MSWGVDNVKAVIFPEATYRCRLDGNSALGFLIHEVGGGLTVVGFTGFVDTARQFEDTLGGGGFTRINVREDTNVSVFG